MWFRGYPWKDNSIKFRRCATVAHGRDHIHIRFPDGSTTTCTEASRLYSDQEMAEEIGIQIGWDSKVTVRTEDFIVIRPWVTYKYWRRIEKARKEAVDGVHHQRSQRQA